jgi:hypothetical protein
MADITTLRANYYKAEYLRSLPRELPVIPTTPPSFTLPLYFDASQYSTPFPFQLSPTFSISSGVIVNAPTIGTELLTDPGLEANYTAGLCDTLTLTGAATVAQSVDVHGGTKAQEFTATAFNNRLNWPIVVGTAGSWYLYSVWSKRTAGIAGKVGIKIYQAGALPDENPTAIISNAIYTQEKLSYLCTANNNTFVYPGIQLDIAPFDTVIVDDGSLKQYTTGDLFALLPSASRLASIKIQPSTLIDHTISGCVIWATNANSYILATYYPYAYDHQYICPGLMKCVNGTYTQLITTAVVLAVANAWMEIRPVDNTTVGLFYDNTQIGAYQNVMDVPGNQAGIMISGGNNIKSVYLGFTKSINLLFAGSSFSIVSSISYNKAIQSLINLQPDLMGSFSTMAVGGAKTWFNLIRLSSYLDVSLQYLFLDTANDDTASDLKDRASLEAFIRRVWQFNPNIIIVLISAPSWNGQDITNDANTPTPTNRISIDAARVIGNYYGVFYAAYLDRIISLVSGGFHRFW